MDSKWSQQAWEAARPVYEAILELPFVKELAAGTLPADKFMFYLCQDTLYIDNYCRVLANIASRLDSMDLTEAFLDFAKDGVFVEKTMHASYLKGVTPQRSQMSPTCMLYNSVQKACATGPVEVEAAAVLPCFWVYLAVGKHIAATAAPSNPYADWIATYSDPLFEASTQRAIDICDALASRASESVRQEMTRMFVLCTRMEWLFWDSAYNMEQWKI